MMMRILFWSLVIGLISLGCGGKKTETASKKTGSSAGKVVAKKAPLAAAGPVGATGAKAVTGATGTATGPTGATGGKAPKTTGKPPAFPNAKAWVLVKPGKFTMGSPATELGRYKDEAQHAVVLSRSFWIQKAEVTQGQYQTLMGKNPSRFKTCGAECPVETVKWTDAILYANALSKKEGLPPCYGPGGKVVGGPTVYGCAGYRLPTESEWEYAARAGNSATRYGKADAIAWHMANAGKKSHPVGKKTANALGLHDMLGNVWEWCHDRTGDYPSGMAKDPTGGTTDSMRVIRGASWLNTANYLRAADRSASAPTYGGPHIGFRLARSGGASTK